MRYLLLLCPLFLLLACGTGNTSEDTTANEAEVPTDPHGITDSVRRLYQTYYAALDSPWPTACTPERHKVNPMDAAPLDTPFFVFREHLKRVVVDKDIFKLLEHVDENIKSSFGGGDGLKSFVQMWQLDSPEQVASSGLWATLSEVLELGGGFSSEGNYFEAPYLGPCWPQAIAEDVELGVIAGAGVRMRGGPGLHTRVVKNLSYDLVAYLETTPIEETISGEVHPWIKVKTMDGTEGFVYGKFFRSPYDFRAVFEKDEDGRWRLGVLVAGD